MTAFFAWHQKHKKIFSRDLKVETNLDFILLFNIAVEKFGKKISWSS